MHDYYDLNCLITWWWQIQESIRNRFTIQIYRIKMNFEAPFNFNVNNIVFILQIAQQYLSLVRCFKLSNLWHCNLRQFFSIQFIEYVYAMIIDMQFAQKFFEVYYTYILKMNWSSAIRFWLDLSKIIFQYTIVLFSV